MLKAKYSIYTGEDNFNNIICSSNTYINLKKAKKLFFEDEDEEEKPMNQYNEAKYIENGEEQKIAIKASESRPYTDYFDEFIPNESEESKRKHKYTVSLHPAI